MATKAEVRKMTDTARAGFTAQGTPNPHMHSSDNWLLYAFGQMLNASGRVMPKECWKSRGYRVKTDQEGLYEYRFDTDHFERIS